MVLLRMHLKVFVLLLASFFYLSIGKQYGFIKYDEGLSVYGALRVMNGDVPYRDFFSSYMPAHFYSLALFFKIFGISLMTERLWSVVGEVLMTFGVYLVGRRLYSEKLAIMAWLVAVLFMGGLKIWGYSMPWAVFLSLLSVCLFFDFLDNRRPPLLFFVGLLNALAFIFRQDIGFYTFLTELLVLIFFLFFSGRKREGMDLQSHCSIFLCYFAGVAVVLLPVSVYFFLVVGGADLQFDLVTVPLQIYPKVRNLPFPVFSLRPGQDPVRMIRSFLDVSCIYFPILIFVITFLMQLLINGKNKFVPKDGIHWKIVAIVFLGIAFFNSARMRLDAVHAIPMTMLAVILFFWVIGHVAITRKGLAIGASILFLLLFLTWPVLKSFLYYGQAARDDYQYPLTVAYGQGVFSRHPFYNDMVQYVQSKVPANERIFVGNVRMEKIVFNDVMFYFLADRQSATRYHELLPGLVTQDSIQKEIINEIRKNKVNYIILWAFSKEEPNESSQGGSRLLDNYIRDNFVVEKKFGNYVVLKKAGSSDLKEGPGIFFWPPAFESNL